MGSKKNKRAKEQSDASSVKKIKKEKLDGDPMNDISDNKRRSQRKHNIANMSTCDNQENDMMNHKAEELLRNYNNEFENQPTADFGDQQSNNIKNSTQPACHSAENITWSSQDILELLNRIEKNIPIDDSLAFNTRVEKLNWHEIAFNDYSVEECKNIWQLLLKRVRKFRLLTEVLADVKTNISNPTDEKSKREPKHPDMPRRPLTAYSLFYLDKKTKLMKNKCNMDGIHLSQHIASLYRNLSPQKREKYDKLAAEAKDKYNKKLKAFEEGHPEYIAQVKAKRNNKSKKGGLVKIKLQPEKPPKKAQTPFGLYFLAELSNCPEGFDKNLFKEKCKEEWKTMPNKNKVPWITKAEEGYEQYIEDLKVYAKKNPNCDIVPVKSVLTKEERIIKERDAGKPVKPPNSYGLYSKIMLQSDEIRAYPPKDRMTYISNKWKALDETEKNVYRDRALNMMEKYKVDYNSYLERLPEEKRKQEMQSKRKIQQRDFNSNKANKKSSALIIETKVPSKIFKEPEQPPITACKYYAQYYHKGNDDPIIAWKNLSDEDKKKYEKELDKKKHVYIIEFEKFLKSLSKNELNEFVKSRQSKVKSEDEDDTSDCSSDEEGEDVCEFHEDKKDSNSE